MNAFGIDISSNQGQVNFTTLATNHPEVVFLGIRNGISWGYTDKWFSYNWSEAKRILRLRTAYHVLYPSQPVQNQMDRFYKLMSDDLGELPETLDAELDQNCSKLQITEAILKSNEINRSRSGRNMILYSRANWLNEHTYFNEIKHLDLWLAQYLSMPFPASEHPGPPALPAGALTWEFHQTGDHTPGKEAGFGVESLQLDYNRFNGTAEDLYRYAGFHPIQSVPLDVWAKELDGWARTHGYEGSYPA